MRRKSMDLFPWDCIKLILLSCLIVWMGMSTCVYAQDCGVDPCPGTTPAIWPDRSAPLGDTSRILGWNLDPYTTYEIVVSPPGAEGVSWDMIITDGEGDLLKTPYSYLVPDIPGIYEVKVFAYPWNGNLEAEPVAMTTFYNWAIK